MSTQFRRLFTVRVAHGYYSAGCRDFAFVMPADTAQLLSNGRLLARTRDGVLYGLLEADEAGTAVVPMAGRTLRIGLKLLNPFFSNFTAFDSKSAVYRNSFQPAALDAAQAISLVGRRFSHALTATPRPVTVSLKNAAGQVLHTQTIDAANDRPSVAYNLAGQAAGAYTVEEAYPAATAATAYYSDAELQRQGIFGIIEIKLDPGFYTTAPEFQIAFAAKEETLKYYVVAKNYSAAEFSQLSVSDQGFTEDGRPRIDFTPVPAAAFTAAEIAPALLGDGDARVVLFKSQAAVARREQARRKIQLSKNSEVLITHLPQPGPDQTRADLIIPIAKP